MEYMETKFDGQQQQQQQQYHHHHQTNSNYERRRLALVVIVVVFIVDFVLVSLSGPIVGTKKNIAFHQIFKVYLVD